MIRVLFACFKGEGVAHGYQLACFKGGRGTSLHIFAYFRGAWHFTAYFEPILWGRGT
jgi:hypothetical protein